MTDSQHCVLIPSLRGKQHILASDLGPMGQPAPPPETASGSNTRNLSSFRPERNASRQQATYSPIYAGELTRDRLAIHEGGHAMIVLILLVLALVSFALGAGGVQAAVNWDQLGKAFLVGALIASQGFGLS